MSKARTLSNFISSGSPLADGTISVSEISGAAPSDSPSFTGNITVSGTVDGRDIAADGTKLDGIEAGATADQTAAEIKTAYESNANTNAFTDAEQSKLAGIEAGATADQTASEILTAIKTVDGAASGLDADLLDGQHATAFATAAQGALADSAVQPGDNISTLTNNSGYITGNQTITLSGDVSGSGTTSIVVTVADDSHNHVISNVDGLQAALDGKLSTSGKAADSNLLDGIDSSSFLRSDVSDTWSGDITTTSTNGIRFGSSNQTDSNDGYIAAGRFSSGLNIVGTQTTAGTGRQVRIWGEVITDGGSKYWHAGNDGAGSGLDADLLDGQQGSYYYSPANPPPASTPNTGLGQVGTYAVLVAANSGVNVGVGGTIAGSSLRYMNNFPFDGDTFVPEASGGGGTTMSGTWRNMSVDKVQYTAGGYYGIGLFVRVS